MAKERSVPAAGHNSEDAGRALHCYNMQGPLQLRHALKAVAPNQGWQSSGQANGNAPELYDCKASNLTPQSPEFVACCPAGFCLFASREPQRLAARLQAQMQFLPLALASGRASDKPCTRVGLSDEGQKRMSGRVQAYSAEVHTAKRLHRLQGAARS